VKISQGWSSVQSILDGRAMRNIALLFVALAGILRVARADDPPAADRAVPLEAKPIEVSGCLIKAVKTARLATDRPGVLADVQPNEGESVHEKQPVARLMDEVPRATLEVAKLVANDEVELKFAQKANAVDNLEYDKILEANRHSFNAIPALEVERAKLAAEKSRLQIEKAKHEMDVNDLKAKQAEAELNTYRILAPFNGVVSRVLKYRGEAVHQGDTILEIVNPNVVKIEGKVNERDVWRVKVGSPVTVHLDIPKANLSVEKRVFHGRIGFVDVVASASSFETRIWAEIDNPENILRPGLLAKMTILPITQDAGGLKTSMRSGPARTTTGHPQP
jgi:membrane fusion protein, multidrug efflux system